MKHQDILTFFALSSVTSAAGTSSADSSCPEVTASVVSERDSGTDARVHGNPGWTKQQELAGEKPRNTNFTSLFRAPATNRP